MDSSADQASFHVKECDGITRIQQPISVGVPIADSNQPDLPRSIVSDSGQVYPCHSEVLSRWPSGTPRWILVTACIDLPANGAATFRLDATPKAADSMIDLRHELVLDKSPSDLFSIGTRLEQLSPELNLSLSVIRQGTQNLEPRISECQQEVDCPVQRRMRIVGTLGDRRPINFYATATLFKLPRLLKLEVTLHNPRRAEHVGGYWDLGDPNSELLESATLRVALDVGVKRTIRWSEQTDGKWSETESPRWSLTQLNSGGKNWQSRVHMDANGKVPDGVRGYQVAFDNMATGGLRATPTVQLNSGRIGLAATMVDFWQKFPSAVEVDGSTLHLHLFPAQPNRSIELQAGERTTRTIWLQLHGPESLPSDLAWVHSPLVAITNQQRLLETGGLEWVASSTGLSSGLMNPQPKTHDALVDNKGDQLPGPEAVADVSPKNGDSSDQRIGEFRRPIVREQAIQDAEGIPSPASETGDSEDETALLEEMLSGDRSFFWKREQVDEYGWRNFGDFWADHEEKYSDDASPVISHYNNQYDLLHGLLRQYLRTRDRRWWELAGPLAEHIVDIDIYHTDRDRAAYNGGLFWHTSHYRDAATCTHRSYSRQMMSGKHSVNGGGPSNEHNYTSGLLLYYHLTGCGLAKNAVLSLADLVIAMDDGRQSLLAPLSSSPTGNASSTAERTYHGPGRGVGNSINALVDAWQLTRSSLYLEKCRELILRVVHPEENIDKLNLLDAEMRWSYTVALQALARFLTVVGDADLDTSAYVRACLIHYGRWMQRHEGLYLDAPQQLEFPTETWPAQDMRKGTTMMLISRWMDQPEKDSVFEAGRELYENAKRQLLSYPSRNLTRPAAIAFQQFPIAGFARLDRDAGYRCALRTRDHWPARSEMRTQKQIVKSNLRSPIGLCKVALNALRISAWKHTIPETPLGQWLRRRTAR